jgi:hypothetical protein
MPLSTSDIVVGTAKSFLKILITLNQQAHMQRLLVGTIAPILFLCGCVWSSSASFADESPKWFVGVAKTDITPEEPVRLSGYASRTTPATEIEDRLFARALVLTPTLQSNAAQSNAAQPNTAKPRHQIRHRRPWKNRIQKKHWSSFPSMRSGSLR